MTPPADDDRVAENVIEMGFYAKYLRWMMLRKCY